MSIHCGLLTEKLYINLAVQAPEKYRTVSLPNFQVSYEYPLRENPIFRINVFIHTYLKVKFWRYTASEQHSWLSLGCSQHSDSFFQRIWLCWTLKSLLGKCYFSFLFQWLKDNLFKKWISMLVWGGRDLHFI